MFALLVAVLVIVVVFGWLLFGDRLAQGEPASKFEELEQRLEISLDDLRDQGVHVDQPIVWNYLFVHRNYTQLGRFVEHMKGAGYDVAEVSEADDGEIGVVDYELRLQKRETHDAQSLAARLSEMRNLAARWHLDLFDGWYPEDYNPPKEVSH